MKCQKAINLKQFAEQRQAKLRTKNCHVVLGGWGSPNIVKYSTKSNLPAAAALAKNVDLKGKNHLWHCLVVFIQLGKMMTKT